MGYIQNRVNKLNWKYFVGEGSQNVDKVEEIS